MTTTGALKCCQSSQSLESAKEEGATLGPFNNNNVLVEKEVKKHYFPKRQACDVNFEDVTYTTWSWSMTRFRRGTFAFVRISRR